MCIRDRPYTVRLLQQKAVEKGCEYIYGAQGLTLVHDNGKVTGAIFTDIDGKYFQVNADAVIVAAGDFGGNPDMRLDLCDTLRNLAWSYGKDRTDVNNISSMGRDGSGTVSYTHLDVYKRQGSSLLSVQVA